MPVGPRLFNLLLLAGAVLSYWLVKEQRLGADGSRYELLMIGLVFGACPLAFALLAYPAGRRPRALLLPLLAGVLFTSWVLPAESKQLWRHVENLRWVLLAGFIATELILLGLLATQWSRLRGSANPEQTLTGAATRLFGAALGRVLAAELMMWYFVLAAKRMPAHVYPGELSFGTHEHGGNASNQLGFLVIIGAEIPIIHGLLWLWRPDVANLVSAVSVYGFLWMLACYRACLMRPVTLDALHLYLRYGVVGEQRVPLTAIANVAETDHAMRDVEGVLRHVPSERPTVRIDLNEALSFRHLFGEAVCRHIVIGVDEPKRFVTALRERIRA